MYDHNQTLVPDSFLALYLRNGRPTLGRIALEARCEVAEALALNIAETVVSVPADDRDGQRLVLQSVKTSLLVPPVQVSEPEATWVIRRVAEICEWQPVDL